jgi:hypothetical protein
MATAGIRRPTNVVILTGILPILLVAAFAAAAQTGRRTIYVTALDRNNQPVPGLTAADGAQEDGRVENHSRRAGEPAVQCALSTMAGLRWCGAASGWEFVERLGKSTFSLVTAADTERASIPEDRACSAR